LEYLMRHDFRAAAFQTAFFLPVPAAVAGWFLIVPQLMNPSTYVAAAGIMAGFGWVSAVTFMNALPASSLAQTLHDAEPITVRVI
jgi:hypothetical protein